MQSGVKKLALSIPTFADGVAVREWFSGSAGRRVAATRDGSEERLYLCVVC